MSDVEFFNAFKVAGLTQVALGRFTREVRTLIPLTRSILAAQTLFQALGTHFELREFSYK
jgi:hypothetical protein